MKSLVKWLVPVAVVFALVVFVPALSALAQGPTTPAPTGNTVGDPLSPTCEWVGIAPAPRPGYFSEVFYKVPYARQTQLVIYMYATKTNPASFKFDVYQPYDAALRYLTYDEKYMNWDNWAGNPVGSSTRTKGELGDLSWAGKLDDGSRDGFYIVDLVNFNPDGVWYKLCYYSYYNVK